MVIDIVAELIVGKNSQVPILSQCSMQTKATIGKDKATGSVEQKEVEANLPFVVEENVREEIHQKGKEGIAWFSCIAEFIGPKPQNGVEKVMGQGPKPMLGQKGINTNSAQAVLAQINLGCFRTLNLWKGI